jgi:hypothetical protein
MLYVKFHIYGKIKTVSISNKYKKKKKISNNKLKKIIQ